MSSPQTITDVAPSGNVATHDVGFSGLPGTIFFTLAGSFLLFMVGFSTIGWQRYSRPSEGTTYWVGLWKTCMCDDVHIHDGEAWFHGAQAMFVIAFLLMLTSLVLILLYMFVPKVKKSVVLTVFCVFSFISFFFLLVGISVFGAKTTETANGGGHQSYSFILTVIAMIFTFAAALLSVFHMRSSGMF